MGEYEVQERIHWIKTHATQIVICVCIIFWAKEVEVRLTTGEQDESRVASLKDYFDISVQQLNDAAIQVGGPLPKLERKTLSSLIVIDVHARDTISKLADMNIFALERSLAR